MSKQDVQYFLQKNRYISVTVDTGIQERGDEDCNKRGI